MIIPDKVIQGQKTYLSLIFLFGIFFGSNSWSQNDVNYLKELERNGDTKIWYKEAKSHMDAGKYEQAISVWELIEKFEPNNANVSYYIGQCFLNLPNRRLEALPHLNNAERRISSEYKEKDPMEREAPIDTKFYLARVYHLTYDFESAIEKYSAFMKKAGRDHKLYKEADLFRSHAEYALEAIKHKGNYYISNIGTPVNSEYSDYGPAVTSDGNMLFFTSKRERPDHSNAGILSDKDGKHFEDVYVAHWDEKSKSWKDPELLDFCDPNNNQASISTSADGQFLFIFKDDEGDGNIYISERDGDKYTPPVMMGPQINSKQWETHACISADGRTLYFTSDAGEGGGDIYRCVRLPNGDWSEALNLGEPVNSARDEICPFLHPDGQTLFFSSDRENSMGGFDIFYSKMDAEGNWQEPINLGHPLNTPSDDVSFTTTADGKTGYFSSFRNDKGVGQQDIYTVKLDTVVVEEIAILKGHIDKGVSKILPDGYEIAVTNLTQDTDPLFFVPNQRTGAYVLNLTPCQKYLIEYSYDGDKFQETEITVPCNSAYHEINKVVLLKKISYTP